jgi:uncharacterized membrane protein YdjX (TVP38/TMEM64 family)
VSLLVRRLFYLLWLVLVISFFIYSWFNPKVYSVDYLKQLLNRYGDFVLIAYVIVSFFRGFFLIPSTPFVLVGAVLFKNQPWIVVSISMGGIMFSAVLLYFFSNALGFSKLLEQKNSSRIEEWSNRLQSKYGFWILLFWCMIPVVPTDLICYLSGLLKFPFKAFCLAVFLGQSILVFIYVFLLDVVV